jgi:hypothetical protein
MATVETFEVGDRVKHPKFGQGTVKQRWGEGERLKVLVHFTGEVGEKKLLVKLAKMKKVVAQERPVLAPGDETHHSSGQISDEEMAEDAEDSEMEADEENDEE